MNSYPSAGKLLTIIFLASLLTGVFFLSARAAPTELFFSEYVEGSSNNKALEIFNGTGAPVDLVAGNYTIEMYFNGSTSPGTTIALTGTVASGDVYVIADDGADPAILAQTDQTSASSFFNGDDAIALLRDGAIIDVIGQIGFDPGSEWGSGDTSTQNNTIRRRSNIEAGDPDGGDAFDPVVEWDGFANDTFEGLGTHTYTPEPTPTPDSPLSTPTPSAEPTTPIGTARGMLGETVTIEGRATVATGSFYAGDGNAKFYVQDETGGVQVQCFGSNGTLPDVTLGDLVRVTGEISEYQNEVQIVPGDNVADIVVTDGAPANVPAPADYAVADIGEATEGWLVRVTGDVESVGSPDAYGNQTIVLTDGTNDLDIRVDGNAGLDTSAIQGGDNYTIVGISSQYDIYYRVMPRIQQDLIENAPPASAIVINEIIQNPAAVLDSDGEWFEIYNASGAAVDLDGWTVSDAGSDSFVIVGPLTIPPDGYLVLGCNGDTSTNGGVEVGYVYGSGMTLANGDDEIILVDAESNEVDRVEYDGGTNWPDPTGASMMLTDVALDNNDGTNWQETPAELIYGDGDRGTPGCPNTGCPPPSETTPIYDIQFTSDPSGDSPLIGQVVTTTGIVYAVYGQGYCIADEGGPWHGIYVYTGSSGDKPQAGDDVEVSGTVQEYYGLTELGYSSFTLLSSGNIPYPSALVTAADIAFDDSASEPYEGVFVEIHDIEVTAGADSHYIWSFTDASTATGKADDWGYRLEPAIGDTYDILRGALIYDWNEYKVMPRDAGDVFSFPEIVVTEIMQNPGAVNDTYGEWFEVYNAGTHAVDMDGWVFSDNGSDAFTVDGSLVIQPGEYLVLGRNGDTTLNGGVQLDYVYSDFYLSNGDDEIVVEMADATEIDRVEYDGGPNWPDPSGASMMLIDVTLDNNDGANWDTTPESLTFGLGDRGTPGCPNTGCLWLDVSIPEIQGIDVTSSYSGTLVRTSGVVVGRFEGNLPSGGGNFDGFYIQDPDGDGDDATSDGMFVNHGALGVSVNLGDLVTVIGTVQEFNEYGDPPPETETQIQVTSSGDVTVVGSGTVTPTTLAPDGTALYFETLEGMLVNLPPEAYAAPVVGPTSYGTFFLVRGDEGVDRVMRGSPQDGKTFGVRNYWRYGSGGPNLIVGSTINAGVEGPLAYSYGNFLVALQNLSALDYTAIDPPASPPTWPSAAAEQLTVASFNTYNFDSTGTELTKVARTIDAMGGPLLIGLQEIAVSTVMTDLLTTLSGMSYDYDYAFSHPDVGGHGVALLWRTDRVASVDWSTEYQSCSEYGSESSTEYDDYCEGTELYPLFSRRPVVATTTVMLEGYPHQVIVIANHFKSKSDGAVGDQRRLEQAQFVASLADQFVAADPDANVVVLGDLNDFENSPALLALTASGNLSNAWYSLSPEARYSYIYNGTSQVLDHILASSHLVDGLQAFGPLHTNADYPYTPYSGDDTVVWRTSDHDPLVSTFYLEPPTLPLEQMRLVYARIQWHPSADGRADFYLREQLELPPGYTRDNLAGDLTLSLNIAGETVAETFTFTPYGNTWRYWAPGQVEDGIKVRYATIRWLPDGVFLTVSGKIDLSDVNQNTQPAEAIVGLHFPVQTPAPVSALVGETFARFWTFGRLWFYLGW